MNACHQAFWDLTPTVDHLIPVSRGGADEDSNWVSTTMLRNSAKGNFMLEELGWSLYPPGDINQWNGLLGWFVKQAKIDHTILDDPCLRRWYGAARVSKIDLKLA